MKRRGLEVDIKADVKTVIEYMTGDKKNIDDRVNLVLLKDMGKPFMHMLTKRELFRIWEVHADA